MKSREKGILGWREWVSFDDLKLPPMKAKVDTGARTSALHGFRVRSFLRRGQRWVRFHVHPLQGDRKTVVVCEAPVIDYRRVSDSGGHAEKRFVIESRVSIRDSKWPIELTLTNRDTMRFRALLGRTAIRGRFLVDPRASFLGGGDKQSPPAELDKETATKEER